jgi:hypothetical protein
VLLPRKCLNPTVCLGQKILTLLSSNPIFSFMLSKLTPMIFYSDNFPVTLSLFLLYNIIIEMKFNKLKFKDGGKNLKQFTKKKE